MPVRKRRILGAEAMDMKVWRSWLARFWKARGFYILTALCLAMVAGAAVYARGRVAPAPAAPSAAGASAPAPAAAALAPAPAPTVTPAPALLWPVSGRRILRDDQPEPAWFEPLGQYETHPGADIAAEAGEEVAAAADGTVAFAGFDPQRGYLVETRAEDGLVLRYGNLSRNLRVSAGDRVRRGQAIGAVGESAPSAAVLGPFLHFEAFRGGARVALP